MGLLDLSTSVTSKKHVDFNDARYQLAESLKPNTNKNIRSTFTLYDKKDVKKTSVTEISAAYMLSDKKLPMGEILNKLVDLIIDMEDGSLDSEQDAIYAWKYSMTLLEIYEDKKKRQEPMSTFDNGLKSMVINNDIFHRERPGKYTNRTNFFNDAIKRELADDIVDIFKNIALPKIHDIAIAQSLQIAERHQNPILDKIVGWAEDNYRCGVSSFYEVMTDEETKLYYSINTIILHLKNGYDMSIIGYVGTDRDDKFAISVFNAHDISLGVHSDRATSKEVQSTVTATTGEAPVNPLVRLVRYEEKRNQILKQQYDILNDIRPMIPADILNIKAAESVVGKDYIWGCRVYRETHDDLPLDFKLSDVVLPELEADAELIELKNTYTSAKLESEDIARTDMTAQITKEEDGSFKQLVTLDKPTDDTPTVENVPHGDAPTAVTLDKHTEPESADSHNPQMVAMKTAVDILNESLQLNDLFDTLAEETKPAEPEPVKEFGKETEIATAPVLPTATLVNPIMQSEPEPVQPQPMVKNTGFDPTSILLPGAIKTIKKEEYTGPSVTSQAEKRPANTAPVFAAPTLEQPKAPEKVVQPIQQPAESKQPELLLDDISSLFN
ncbi:MAG: hypothetical protein IJ419_02370 [Agathobacter sp.]|nr:hypothetical protein [Agathobacter sp.]